MKSLDAMDWSEIAAAIDNVCAELKLEKTVMANRQRALGLLMNRQGPPQAPVATLIDLGDVLNTVPSPAVRRKLGEHAACVRTPEQRLEFERVLFAERGRSVAGAASLEEAVHAVGRRDGLDLRKRTDYSQATLRVARERPDLVPVYGTAPPSPVQLAEDQRDARLAAKLDAMHERECEKRNWFPNTSPDIDHKRYALRRQLADALVAEEREAVLMAEASTSDSVETIAVWIADLLRREPDALDGPPGALTTRVAAKFPRAETRTVASALARAVRNLDARLAAARRERT